MSKKKKKKAAVAKKKKASRCFTKKERRKVQDLIWQAQCDLHADEYLINFIELKKDEKEDEEGRYLLGARITVKPKYLRADIEIPPVTRKAFRKDFGHFFKTIYHEVAHIVVDPLYLDQCDDLAQIERHYYNEKREQAVEKVGRIARWRRKHFDEIERLKEEIKILKGGDK